MEFAKLSDESSREASPPPRLVDLLHLVVARVEEGSLQGRLESDPVSSTDRDRGTRVRG